jgi:hypothetical protein
MWEIVSEAARTPAAKHGTAYHAANWDSGILGPAFALRANLVQNATVKSKIAPRPCELNAEAIKS